MSRPSCINDQGVDSAPPTKLKRGITTLLLFFFIVGDTLGAGIYTLVGTMAQDVGGAIWVPLILALVLALLTAGTYAELMTRNLYLMQPHRPQRPTSVRSAGTAEMH